MSKFRLLHTTDIHLNFAEELYIKQFCEKIRAEKPDAMVITGDIAEAPSLVEYLAFLGIHCKDEFPIFFVLGNHDYYNGSISEVRETMTKFFTYDDASKMILEPRFGWLGSSGIIPLTEKTALIGHDGWYDGQYANWFTSKVYLNDYLLIRELADTACPIKELRYVKINDLSEESAFYIKCHIDEAVKTFDNIFVATHVSPFRENAVYAGKVSNDDWMPHFSSKQLGDVLLDAADNYPDKNFTVLCGHSHGSADNQITPNLRCITGAARYRFPKINNVFEIE